MYLISVTYAMYLVGPAGQVPYFVLGEALAVSVSFTPVKAQISKIPKLEFSIAAAAAFGYEFRGGRLGRAV